jgi:hypothetical protein
MIFAGIMLSLVIMAVMVYLAFDKKSSFSIKVASLIALGIMIITIIVCLSLFFTDTRVPVDPSRLIVGAPVEEKKDVGGNTMILLLLIIFLIAIFTVIVVFAMHEQKKGIKGHNVTNSLW